MNRRNRRNEYQDYYFDDRDAAGAVRAAPRVLPHVVVLMALFGGGLAAVHYFAGPRMFEKVAQELASPVGLVWLLLFVSWYWALLWRIKLLSFCSGLAWLLLTAFGNAFVANELVRFVERPYLAIEPLAQDKLACILVLGGGSDSTPAGVPQLSSRGDRLALAARLFHAGKVEQIALSGMRWNKAAGDTELYEESATILKQLGVPDANIVQLKVGVDTSEEIQGLKRWLAEVSRPPAAETTAPQTAQPPDPEQTTGTQDTANPNDAEIAPTAETNFPGGVGLLTSAWHLRRAMMLAERYGVAVQPIPADFLSGPVPRDPSRMIPTADNLVVSQLALREILAYWLDR